MNLIWPLLRIAGIAALTVGGVTLLVRKMSTDSSTFVTGAIHFQRGFQEFQRGFASIFFGSDESDSEDLKKKQELSRIPIE